MTVQDDERERELVRLFNLSWDASHQRSGVDALLRLNVDGQAHALEVEVKSTTTDTVSTARDVSMQHIEKWRRKLFVIGFYSRHERRPELLRSICLTPDDMKSWIDSIEAKIVIDHRIAQCSSAGLKLKDLWAVCGRKPYYTPDDARAVLRQQWSADQYLRGAHACNEAGQPVFSSAAMLEVLRARALYIAQRGATLNNPHITRGHLSAFEGSSREVTSEWASRIRTIATEWLRRSPP